MAFDTETTGLSFGARLVELAGIRFHGDTILGTFETLVNPGESIPVEATRIHGIQDADVAVAPGVGEALAEFEAFSAGAILVAHNAPYDVSVVSTEYVRLRRPPPAQPVLDTCALARAIGLRVRDYKLTTLAGYFGLDTTGMHRALADSRVVQRVFIGCLQAAGLGSQPPMAAIEQFARTSTLADVVQIMENLPAHLKPLVRAMEDSAPITIRYSGGTKGPDPRVVSPLVFYMRDGVAYMEAIAAEDGIRKNFRLDRIIDVLAR